MEVTSGFWAGRRVLLTGHTGFKGSWMALWLQALGSEVIGFALPPPTQPSLFELADVEAGMTSVEGDVRDLAAVEDVVRRYRPEVVIHMAAQSLVRRSYEDPVATYDTNVMGTVHLLEAIRRIGGVDAVVCVTSDKCYENRETDYAYVEDDPVGGHDPYSSSKGCDELVVASYRRSFFPPTTYGEHGTAVASARAGNVIGGGDWAQDRLVADIMQAVLAGREVAIRNLSAVRPWQHVLDPLAGYLALAEALTTDGPSYAEPWNFGPPEEDVRPVSWIVDRLVALWGEDARWVRDRSDHPHEAKLLMLDASKARERLGWKPRLSLEDALGWIVEWYRGYRDQHDMRDRTLEQIARWEAGVPA